MYSETQNIKYEKPSIDKPRTYFPVKIVYVWTLVFAAMVIYAISWYTLGTVALAVIEAVEGSFHFSPPWDSVTALIKNMVYFHPVISLIGWLVWGFLSSTKRNTQQWETS